MMVSLHSSLGERQSETLSQTGRQAGRQADRQQLYYVLLREGSLNNSRQHLTFLLLLLLFWTEFSLLLPTLECNGTIWRDPPALGLPKCGDDRREPTAAGSPTTPPPIRPPTTRACLPDSFTAECLAGLPNSFYREI